MGKTLKGIEITFFALMIISIIMFFGSENSKVMGFGFLGFCLSLFILLICAMVERSEADLEYYRQERQRRHYVCNKCGYEWISKKSIGRPSRCPDCNSKNIIRSAEKFE